MQLQKDVLIAGGVVIACVALVVVALVATGKQDKPTQPIADNGLSSPQPGFGGNDFPTSGSPAPGTDPAFGGNSLGGNSLGGYQPGAAPGGYPGPGAYPGPSGPTSGSPLAPIPAPGAVSDPLAGGPIGGTPPAFDPGLSGPAPVPGVSPGPVAAPDPLPLPGATTTKGGGTHTVAKGETLGDISHIHYGTSKHWRKIVEANPGLDPVRLKTGQVIQIPAVESTAPAQSQPGAPGTYTVQKGDSYYIIAKKELGSAGRWREIERLNNVPAEDLKVGTVLKLPAKDNGGAAPGAPQGGGKTHIVAKGETLGDISKQYFGTTTKWKAIVEANPGVRAENLKVGQSLAIPDLPVAAPAGGGAAAVPGGNTYTVKSGDTLETIAAAQLGKKTAWKQIAEANPGLKPSSLRVGQQIAIPGAAAAPAPAPGLPTGGGLGTPAPIGGPAPLPMGNAPTPAPAPVVPPPTFKDDPFFSPYDAKPAAPVGAAPSPGI